MYLHLLYDKKFAKDQIGVFEKYHPDQSLYLITRGDDVAGLDNRNTMLLEGFSLRSLSKIAQRCEGRIECVFVYNAIDLHCKIALYIKKKLGSKIYWMFFGADLYDNLYYRYNYKLIDNEKKTISKYFLDKLRLFKHWPLFKRYAVNVDFFCFWNIYDYQLLKKYVKTNAQFKFYTHDEGIIIEKSYIDKKSYNPKCIVQINHSASNNANHLTILKKLVEIDPDRDLKLIIPLSYGDKRIVSKVEDYCIKEGLNAQILKDFIPKEEYFQLIEHVNVAIYGHHRQEGGGNIIQAFKNGTKVFLREDNNLLKLYRDWGIKVFSFEKDLNRIEDLITPLPVEDQRNNYYRLQHNLSQEKVGESMKHFFD